MASNINFHPNTLPSNTFDLAIKIQQSSPQFLSSFYLSGGTALSLLIGHRESEDLDFFSQNSFDPIKIQHQLESLGSLNQTQVDSNTLNTFLGRVKLQFLYYPYKLLEPTNSWEGIEVSSVVDVACTKFQTIASRGAKKDFIDLYFLLQLNSLEFYFNKMKEKYDNVDYSQAHVLKSLLYFNQADNQPNPRMQEDISWEDIKADLIQKVRSYGL